jgi:hypothetical protein
MATSQKLKQVVEPDTELPSFGEQGVGTLAQDLLALAAGDGWRAVGNESAEALPFHDNPGPFEFEVGPSDRVGVDHELLGEDADGGYFGAGREVIGGDEVFNLVDDLEVERGAGGGLQAELHGAWSINALVQ